MGGREGAGGGGEQQEGRMSYFNIPRQRLRSSLVSIEAVSPHLVWETKLSLTQKAPAAQEKVASWQLSSLAEAN